MILNTEICIAIKDELGCYNIRCFSIFELEKVLSEPAFFEVTSHKKFELAFNVKCPVCSEYHYYSFHISDFIRREMTIGGCETTGIPIFIIGNEAKVYSHINKYRELNERVYAMI